MINFIYQVLRTARLRQWLKNLSLFAAPVFSGMLFFGDTFINTLQGVMVFCAISSGVYFFNDIKDVEKDRHHPVKKNRAIASGKLSVKAAWLFLALFWGFGIIYGYLFVGGFFTLIIIAYVLMQISYSLYFKNVIILEALIVAAGFIFRVFAGGVAGESSVSSWLILTTIGLSLLLAFGKRQSEKTLMMKHLDDKNKIDTRKALRQYPDNLLNSMITMSATFCIISYALFTFQISPQITNDTLIAVLPSILRSPKWMMLTIPLVIYGVARYLYVIYEKEAGESPARVLLSDKPLLLTVIIWGMSAMAIIYIPLILALDTIQENLFF